MDISYRVSFIQKRPRYTIKPLQHFHVYFIFKLITASNLYRIERYINRNKRAPTIFFT